MTFTSEGANLDPREISKWVEGVHSKKLQFDSVSEQSFIKGINPHTYQGVWKLTNVDLPFHFQNSREKLFFLYDSKHDDPELIQKG